MISKTKKRNTLISNHNKGFSLIELIVVILFILLIAALLLPNLLDRVKDAKMSAEISEARMATLALQTVLVIDREKEEDTILNRTDIYDIRLTKDGLERVKELTGSPFGTLKEIKIDTNDKIISYKYRTVHGSLVEYMDGAYEVIDLH